jgi:hypothetical protein
MIWTLSVITDDLTDSSTLIEKKFVPDWFLEWSQMNTSRNALVLLCRFLEHYHREGHGSWPEVFGTGKAFFH